MKSAFSSYIRTCAHTPAQTGEEQSNHCYLYEGFTRRVFFTRNPLLNRLLRESHPNERSTTHLRGRTLIRAYLGCARLLPDPSALDKTPLS